MKKSLLSLALAFKVSLSPPLFSAATAERTIENISYRSQGSATIALITLSDESVWKWMPDPYSENLLRKWTKGDSIIIGVDNRPGFLLENSSHPYYIPTAALSFNSYSLFPTLKHYQKTSNTIVLSDQSKWTVLYDFDQHTLSRWALGDQIIPVKGIHDNYQLINLDISHETRSRINRHIEVAPLEKNS